MEPGSTRAEAAEPPRKPYESPRLEVYGDIRSVTDSVGMMGMADGGPHNMAKTG
jgi:hypothetical protein